MDSSKFPQSSDECSSSESGWTAYIGSSDHEEDHGGGDDDEGRGRDRDEEDEKEANSDDSMASDASSGPSYQYGHLFNKHHGSGHAKSSSERKEAGKKEQKQEDKRHRGEKMKPAKDKADCAARSKRK